MKPFWRKVWGSMNGVGLGSLGATTLYGEFGQYNDQFSPLAGSVCGAFEGLGGTNIHDVCFTNNTEFSTDNVFITGSEVERWGLGVVQEIDAAAMHVFARWQHQEADIDFTGVTLNCEGTDCDATKHHISQGFDDWDLFQVGGIIFF